MNNPRPVSGRYADIAQQVVRCPDKAEGAGSTPAFGTMGARHSNQGLSYEIM